MKIKFNELSPASFKFKDLVAEETFIYDVGPLPITDHTYVYAVLNALDSVGEPISDGNAICLNDMQICSVGAETKVIPVECKMEWSVR